ncbi:Glyoxalase/bleomycin resistance protein/dioxygenase [Shewanella denitrificans OS217]|jgi:catechol 2,3-dioxygenase-like lactoylglutathione lyase family enzyme|uniref:Glyoxalase/bleomycin resistance protein/dioxygenase n=1 Tax=Shewanella denitrificans (strain OS217 / ATCC BAA-1090 / DSM 15013) TaxID=318161 RepID=Q12MC0_SHEDO|nr:VOC family protein [Shewanella denitrificans]ABE55406.1 Glyoxalase/bleomycin resistance protein/dioxygenase [Shewanella denitrificans OS217]
MMRLEHVNLVVRDIEETLVFYRAAFPHWQVRGGGKGSWYGEPRDWVHFGDDYNYLTFNDSGVGENRDLKSVVLGLSHFAFVVDDLDAVVRRLVKAGFEIAIDGGNTLHRKNIYFLDPNGFEVEFVQYLSDIPSERNLYD